MGFHWPELVVLLGVALIIFGPKRLPEIGSALGKGIREFKKGTSELEEKVADSHPVQIPPVQETDILVPERPLEPVQSSVDKEAH